MTNRRERVALGSARPEPNRAAPGTPEGRHTVAAALVGVQLKALGSVLLALALIVGIAPFAQPGARAASPRVAIIVGPVGGLTDLYRADAEAAAAEARRWTDDVVTVYSPNATWAAAKTAMTGASIVVYLGHGNGFPSRYGQALNPKTQNGLGLNPVAGEGDSAHQYFGETYLARQVRLAPDAVVVLSHLCYASGNSEPGLPEGTLDMARQRVDNFAAGFLAAGAGAVIADAHGPPAYYVRSILAGKGTIERIWRQAPGFNDHVIAYPSVRTPGLTALLDPTRPRSQFYRSLVTRAELRADEVARGAALRAGTGAAPGVEVPAAPARVGPAVAKASLRGRPVAGATVELALAFSDPGSEPPADLAVGVRWTPIELRPAVSPEPSPVATPAPVAASPTPAAPTASDAPVAPAASDAPSPPPVSPDLAGLVSTEPLIPPALPAPASPEPTPDPAAAATPAPEPPADPAAGLVAVEVPGAVVMLAPTKANTKGARVALEVPAQPGVYRLATTLHDGDGVAFDATTQQRLPALIVRVSADLSARIAVADHVATIAGARLELPVAILNSGTVPWAVAAAPGVPDYEEAPATNAAPASAFLVGQWLRIDPPGGAPATEVVRERVVAAPGETGRATLRLVAPEMPGSYLLVIDVVSPLRGSLVAAGEDPATVRVTVGWPPKPEFAPRPEYAPAPELAPAPEPADPGAALPTDPASSPADPAATAAPAGAPASGL